MFCCDHEEVRPDILVMGKALSGGMLPVSGCMADDFIMKNIGPGDHGSTYGGNPLAMATANAAVRTIVEEGLVENSAVLGEIFKAELQKIKSPIIKEVRGKGLFIGIEVGSAPDIHVNGNHLAKMFCRHGLLTKATRDSTVRLTPPLVINKSEIMNAVEIAHKAIKDLEAYNMAYVANAKH